MELLELPTEWLKCRSFGHTWEEFLPVGKRKPEFGFRISLLCTTCSMERHDILDVLGNLATRDYKEPEGYYGVGQFTRAEFRVAYDQKRSTRRIARRGDLARAV
jgi:hypothetical protein